MTPLQKKKKKHELSPQAVVMLSQIPDQTESSQSGSCMWKKAIGIYIIDAWCSHPVKVDGQCRSVFIYQVKYINQNSNKSMTTQWTSHALLCVV